MMMAIAARVERSPGEKPFEDRFYITSNFKKIFDRMGILLFPMLSGEFTDTVCSKADGLILPGSFSDIDPSYYGHTPIKGKDYTIDEFKDDMTLIKAFAAAKKPILGICGGMQSINVCFGGTLHQQISGHFIHEGMQNINLVRDSFVRKACGQDHILVNSFHNQAVDLTAPGFKVTATSDDGITEAIEMGNIIGVQWHPEVLDDMAFFKNFVDLCKMK